MATQSATARGGFKATQCTTFINKNGQKVRCGNFVSPGTPTCAAGHKNENTLVPVIDARTPVSGVAALDGTISVEDLPAFLGGPRAARPGDTYEKSKEQAPGRERRTRISTSSASVNGARAASARKVAKRAGQVAAASAALGVVAVILGL